MLVLLSEATYQNFHPFLIHYAGPITRTLFWPYESLITHFTKKRTAVRAKCKPKQTITTLWKALTQHKGGWESVGRLSTDSPAWTYNGKSRSPFELRKRFRITPRSALQMSQRSVSRSREHILKEPLQETWPDGTSCVINSEWTVSTIKLLIHHVRWLEFL